MKPDTDVLIVGGGPSGSFTALNLAKLGVRVTVLEEHNEVGFPPHCAGHLSIGGLARLGLFPLASDIIENVFYGATFYSAKGNAFSVNLDWPVTCAVNRPLFDRHIAQLAEKEGVKFRLNTRVEALIFERNSTRGIVVNHQGRREEIRSKIVVDAEGVTSRLLKQTGLRSTNNLQVIKGLEAELENVENTSLENVEVYLGQDYAPKFYAWLIPKPGGRAKVGLGAGHGDPREFLKKFMVEHPIASRKLRKARVLSLAFHPITLGGLIPSACADGFLTVGDAAGQVKPTTGGGVIFGLTCARVAADVVKAAIDNGDYSARSLHPYQTRIDSQFGFDEKMMLTMRRMLDMLSDEQVDSLIKFCVDFKLDKVLRSVEDLDFQGRSLLKTLRNPRVIAGLGYFAYILLHTNPYRNISTSETRSGRDN